MQFQIEVIQINEKQNLKNKAGKPYNAIEAVYKKDGKVEAKSFPDWSNKDIYPVLRALNPGDVRTVTTEKNEQGFWQWLSVSSDGATAPSADVGQDSKPTGPSSRPQAGTGKVLGSNYETPEERAFKQRCIVAQSSISNALDFAKATNPKGIIPADFLLERAADRIYEYVMAKAEQRQEAPKTGGPVDLFADLADDIPQ